MNRICLLLIGAVLILPGCSQYAVVRKSTPVLQTGTATAASLTTLVEKAERRPDDALPVLLQAGSDAAGTLQSSPNDGAALQEYNFAVARLFTAIRAADLDPWKKALPVPGGWTLSAHVVTPGAPDPSLFDFEPSDQLEVKGSYVKTRTVRPGLGASLVVTQKRSEVVPYDKFDQGEKGWYGVTAVARFQGKHCVISVADPLDTETVDFAGHRFPLAADFTAPLALSLAAAKPKKQELLRVLNPQKYKNTARLARLQLYDPDKIPVICVHGLMDSQATWVPLINTLRGDPEIRKHYQFWFFSYPSGYPYPLSAAYFRKQLDEIGRVYPNHRKAVLIGHSMGGMISRLMITDSGETLWRSQFGKSPEETKLSPQSSALLESTLVFKHRPDVARVIFIATPHRGTDLAGNWIGRLGSDLVKAPSALLGISGEVASMLQPAQGVLQVEGVPNSVDTLAPNNRFVLAVNSIPVTPGIPFHSIIGDRGEGGNKDHTKPVSSDGFVPYWSSHMDGAASELIVPSGHSAQKNDAAIAEVRRILKRHAARSGGD